jgi:hypothetical protein
MWLKSVVKSKMEVRERMEEKMQSDFEGNRKMYWKMVRKVSKGGAVSANGVRNLEGEIVWDEGESLECWRKYFMNLYEDDVRNEVDCESQERMNDEMNQEQPEISMKELLECMKKLKNGKAPGIDGVTSEMIKYASPMWLSYLCQFFNVCMNCAAVAYGDLYRR